jgi:hypothetical protein
MNAKFKYVNIFKLRQLPQKQGQVVQLFDDHNSHYTGPHFLDVAQEMYLIILRLSPHYAH